MNLIESLIDGYPKDENAVIVEAKWKRCIHNLRTIFCELFAKIFTFCIPFEKFSINRQISRYLADKSGNVLHFQCFIMWIVELATVETNISIGKVNRRFYNLFFIFSCAYIAQKQYSI